MAIGAGLSARLAAVKSKLQANHLWQRMVKHTIAVTIAVTIVVIPAVAHRYGPASYLAAMTAVFCHCSQRFGQMAQALIFTLIGTVLGLGWSALGMYLSSLAFNSNEPGAYTIRAIFLVVVSIVHGYVRSQSPRLFVLVWLFLLTSFTTLVGTANHVSASTVTNILYPILTSMGVLLIVNVTIFPEFSSDFLADTTIQTLSQTQTTLKTATEWFMEPREETTTGRAEKHSTAGSAKSMKASSQQSRLANLTAAKSKLRAKLSSCKSALQECMFEMEYAVVPSRSLKPISSTAMAGLVRNVNTLISACESKFVLMGAAETSVGDDESDYGSSVSESGLLSPGYEEPGGEQNGQGSRRPSRRSQLPSSMPTSRRTSLEERLEHVKPQREIASGNPDVLETLLARVREPVRDLLAQVDTAILLVVSCLAYCYDIKKLPTGGFAPKGISIEELDIRTDDFAAAVTFYDRCFQESLSKVAAAEAAQEEVDVMPSMETFLLASSLLSLRQAAEHIMQMLKHARTLVARRQARRDRKRLYWPRKINWNRFLRSGGEQDVMTLPENARKEVRTGKDNREGKSKEKEADNDSDSDSEEDATASISRRDEEANPPRPMVHAAPSPAGGSIPKPKAGPRRPQPRTYSPLWVRARLADYIESVGRSEHFAYAVKLTVAVMLVSWIAFYGPLNGWYNSMRVVWAPLQLVLVFEVAIGSSLWIFFVRAFGVVFGCLWGYASFEIGRGNLVALVVILVIGIIPSAYVQLGTPYVKAGMIAIVSMCIVALSTVSGSGPAWENFIKRLVNFLVGGTVALLVEVVLYPVRARDRLVESLSSSIGHIARMEGILATGSESPTRVTALRSCKLNARFVSAQQKAQDSLSAAETFLPFCLSEPRLKGSFRALEPIYKEIVYVLQQIIDRMDNSISLRRAYGSSVLEDLNPHVYTYRRDVAAAITLTLFAANEALTTKIPLPQFLPSCRLAQMRLVHRVREVIQTEQSALVAGGTLPSPPQTPTGGGGGGREPPPARIDSAVIRNATEQKFLSWSAAAAGQMEIIEYLEELVDLTKLLVGVNAFRSGMLERPSYRTYANRLRMMEGRKRAREKRERDGDEGFDGAAGEVDRGDGGTMSPVASAPTVLRRRRTGSSGLARGSGRRRSVTGVLRGRGGSNAEKEAKRTLAEVVENELPVTLQRMGTRLRQERSLGGVDKSRDT